MPERETLSPARPRRPASSSDEGGSYKGQHRPKTSRTQGSAHSGCLAARTHAEIRENGGWLCAGLREAGRIVKKTPA
jgi:hypothetical protein